MVRHVLAPIHPSSAAALGLPRAVGGDGVALTFDDGPHPDGTPAVLEVLASFGAVATFFVIGEQVARRPELVRRVLAEGHAVALHGHVHRCQLGLTRAQVRDDLDRGRAAVEDAAGVALSRHRPPFGVYSPAGLERVRRMGLSPLLWATWGKDWRKFTTPVRIANRAVTTARPGDAILLHDADFYSSRGSHERTAAALPLILDVLKARGIGTVLAV
jgi:peptidoglycan/xylan/chitin deacetylase (PgdA/CDA1 family)